MKAQYHGFAIHFNIWLKTIHMSPHQDSILNIYSKNFQIGFVPMDMIYDNPLRSLKMKAIKDSLASIMVPDKSVLLL